MVRGQPKGITKGIIQPRQSLPRRLLSTGDELLISQHVDLIQEYLKHVKRSAWWHQQHSFATVGVYTAFFYRCLGRRVYEPQELSLQDLLALYSASHAETGVKNSTLLEHCRRLTVLGTILHNLGILRDGPVTTRNKEVQEFFASLLQRSVQHSPHSHHHNQGFNVGEVSQIYSSTTNHTEFVLLLLLLTTGIRVGGAVHIRVDGLCDDPEATPCTVRSEGYTMEKGGVTHKFFICPVLRHWIQRHIEAHPVRPAYLFPSRYNPQQPCSVGHLQCIFRQICTRAGIEGPKNIHRTRHTLAHALRLAGAPAKHIQLMLGHTCARTTDQYGSLGMNELIERMRLPWAGVENHLQIRDQSALLRNLCPADGYRLSWMGEAGHHASHFNNTTAVADNVTMCDNVEVVSVQHVLELLAGVVGRKVVPGLRSATVMLTT